MSENPKGKVKSKVIGIRVDPDMDARLQEMSKATKIEPVDLVRIAFETLLEAYEEQGRIEFPFKFVNPSPSKPAGGAGKKQ